MKKEKEYDVIIVGGSYAGLAAGMALGRALRRVLIIDSGNPCNRQTPYSHNFLTNDGKPPAAIAGMAKQQLQAYDTIYFVDDLAIAGTKTGNGFSVDVQSGKRYAAKKIIFATGIKDIMPAMPGFAECWGISVLHCPYCHGYEVRHQKTGILENGESGYEFASLISNWTSHLTLFTNGKSTLSPQQTAKLQKHNIDVVQTEVDHLEHQDGQVQHIVFKNGRKAAVSALYTRLPFVQHSAIPAEWGCGLTTEGYIKIDAAQETTLHGVFACGDNSARMRTVANAVSMGTTTGLMVNKELTEEEF